MRRATNRANGRVGSRTGAAALGVALLSLSVLAAATAAPSAEAGTPTPTAAAREASLGFAASQIQSIRLNVGGQAIGPGDRLVFSQTLSRQGRTAGLAGVECVVTAVTTEQRRAGGKNGTASKAKQASSAKRALRVPHSHCVASLSLTDGQITAQGLATLGEAGGPFTLAITGGTGSYAGATGTVRKSGKPAKGTITVVRSDRADG